MKNTKLLILSLFLVFSTQAQQPSEKDLKNAFAPKGTHRAPFKNVNEVALTSVNLQFKLATRQEQEKRNAGNVVTWGFLEGVDDQLLQEITNEYYNNLVNKLKAHGYNLNTEYKSHKAYQKLIENNADLDRETNKKSWGAAKIFTANNAPYIEYPIAMMGPHATLGNDLKMPIGQIFITIDFIEITQNIQKGIMQYIINEKGNKTLESFNTFSSDIRPVIRIEGISSTSLGKQFKGDGTYTKFTGVNWSYCNAIFKNDFTLTSPLIFANDVEVTKGIPESMKVFKSNTLTDLKNIISNGALKSGKGTLETTYTIKVDKEAYKDAVLDALNKYNEYLIAYIKANN